MSLVDSIRNIFGFSTPVAYRPPDPEPKRQDGPHHGDHAQRRARARAGKAHLGARLEA